MDNEMNNIGMVCDKCSEALRQIFHEQGGLECLKRLIMTDKLISVKVKDTNEIGTEWFWINNPRFIGNNIVGTVGHELVLLEYKNGDIVNIDEKSIQNFCYYENRMRISFLPLEMDKLKELLHNAHD